MSSTHLIGDGKVPDPGALPALAGFGVEPWALGEIGVLHVNYEIAASGMLSTLPPALHPSIPPHLSWLAYQVADSVHGPFTLVQTRVGCRIGIKPRGLLVGAVCDNPAAATALTRGWGLRVEPGRVLLRRRADQVELRVSVPGDGEILALDLLDPAVLAGSAVPIAPGLALAGTPRGVRLVQVDPEYVIAAVDRGRPVVHGFDARRWGHGGLRPTWPISGTFLRAEVTLPRLRYLTDPTVPAGAATERLPE